MKNDLWGIRNLAEDSIQVKNNGFFQENIIRMLANNFSIIYIKVI